MRLFLLTLPITVLGACAAQAPQTAATAVAAPPFEVPMDPAQIQCSALTNPTALAAATDWAMGNARAAALAGTIDAIPNADALAQNITSYCSANARDTVGTAAQQLGI